MRYCLKALAEEWRPPYVADGELEDISARGVEMVLRVVVWQTATAQLKSPEAPLETLARAYNSFARLSPPPPPSLSDTIQCHYHTWPSVAAQPSPTFNSLWLQNDHFKFLLRQKLTKLQLTNLTEHAYFMDSNAPETCLGIQCPFSEVDVSKFGMYNGLYLPFMP